MERRSIQIVLIGGIILTSVGCAYSITGGLIGGIVTAVLTGVLLLGVGTTTSSCESSVSTCLSMIPDSDDPDMGPCLSQPPPDVVGPCLTAPMDAFDDTGAGPCLTAPQPDTTEPDIGPCLSQAPPDAQSAVEPDMNAENASHTAMAVSRNAVQKRLIAEGVLPNDVAAQLTDKKEKT